MSEIQAAGARVEGSFASNQLPPLDNVVAGWEYYLTSADGSAAYNATTYTFTIQSYRQAGSTTEAVACSVQSCSGIIAFATVAAAGGNNYTVTVRFSTNSGSQRSGSVKIVQSGSGKTSTCTLRQSANPSTMINTMTLLMTTELQNREPMLQGASYTLEYGVTSDIYTGTLQGTVGGSSATEVRWTGYYSYFRITINYTAMNAIALEPTSTIHYNKLTPSTFLRGAVLQFVGDLDTSAYPKNGVITLDVN